MDDTRNKKAPCKVRICAKMGEEGGTKVRIKCTWVKKLVKKMVKWKDLCSGMPKRDSCSRNQLFHLEIVSLPRSLFATSFDFFFVFPSLFYTYRFDSMGTSFTVGACDTPIRHHSTPWHRSVLRLADGCLQNKHLSERDTHNSSSSCAWRLFDNSVRWPAQVDWSGR